VAEVESEPAAASKLEGESRTGPFYEQVTTMSAPEKLAAFRGSDPLDSLS